MNCDLVFKFKYKGITIGKFVLNNNMCNIFFETDYFVNQKKLEKSLMLWFQQMIVKIYDVDISLTDISVKTVIESEQEC